MADAAPTVFTWDAERGVMVPLRPAYAMRMFVDQLQYRLGIAEERSTNSHNHYFAALNEAWINLPEVEALRFPTSEHLRKHALIKAGYCNRREMVCRSRREALTIASFIEPMDEYAVVAANEACVTVSTARSQSMRAMGKKDFEESKRAVLEICAALVGTPLTDLQHNAGRAA